MPGSCRSLRLYGLQGCFRKQCEGEGCGNAKTAVTAERAILALSTAFWDACLKGDKAAGAWLDDEGPQSVLEKEDRWQKK
ncbi:MAG: hypothetical protein C0404_02505 [Verrucomicrobia bacterium]|nr:hypothetical protein [Verrucomicrobiota bacterium]